MTATVQVPEPLTLDGCVPYPAATAERYRELGLWNGTTLDQLLRGAVADRPAGTAVVAVDDRLTYAALDTRVDAMAAGLSARGVVRGDRVVVQLPNTAAFVVVVFALWRLGALPVFALPAHRRSDIAYFCRHTEAVGYVTCGEHAGFDHAALAAELAGELDLRIVAIHEPVGDLPGGLVDLADLGRAAPTTTVVDAAHPSDIAFLQLSGGTTGTPKLIPRTHDDYLFSVRESARICGLDADSVLLVALPVAHNFAMSSPGMLGVVAARGTLVLAPDPSPTTVLGLVETERATILPAVPALALAWLNSPEARTSDLTSLQVLQVGGARLADTVARRVAPELGCTLQQVFGMAEGLVNYTRLDDDVDTIVSTQGLRISPHDEVLVVDDADAPVPTGTPGHLLTRGPYTIRGYYRAPEHDARSFTTDGFYRTGDLVVERADGYLTVVGRSKDQINRAGEKIAPAEVEEHLLRHPAVHDVAVTGAPDDIVGERIRAHVVLRDESAPVRPADLRRHLRETGLASYKVPDEIVLTDRLPATGVGKIDRRTLTAGEPQ